MTSKVRKSTGSKPKKQPLFVLRAERAMLRAAENVRKENRAFNLPLIVWENGKVVERPA